MENVSNAREAACSASIRSSSIVHDLALKVERQICLLLFRVAEVHKLPHSVTESKYINFKVTFLEIIRSCASQIQQNVALKSAWEKLRKFFACDFLEEIFQGTSSKYQRDNFAKALLPYAKPEEHHLEVCETFQYVFLPHVLQNLMCKTFRDHLDKDKHFSVEQPSPVLQSSYDGLLFQEKLSALLENGAQYTLLFFTVMN